MSYNDLTAPERISCVHLDLMRDPEFSRIGPATQIGQSIVTGAECPTAKTDGLSRWYNREWVMRMSRQQLRAVVAHECLHMLLMHCVLYRPQFKAHPQEAAQAIDYVVNLMVVDMDAGRGFIQWPTDYPPLLDEQYRDMSCLEVIAALLRQKQPAHEQGAPAPKAGKGFDEHEQRTPDSIEAEAEEAKMLDDARVQGEITSSRLRGEGAGAANLKGFEQTETEWREPLRQFMQENMQGDENSRWCPPNKLFRPLGILMPSHYSEAAGELVVACDTSGSMRPYYGAVFGEIGRVAEQVQPRSITVIWWDTQVSNVQVFYPIDYPQLKDKLQARGGGGTRVGCVATYMREHGMNPQATIMLTDGEIESRYECPPGPLLWGIVGNARFTPLKGKMLRIGKETLR